MDEAADAPEDDPDLPGYDPTRAQALLDALRLAAAEGVRPSAPDALDPVHRGRELQRLVATRGALPARTTAAVWRELEGARLDRSESLRLAVWGGREPEAVAAHARRRFGAAPRMAVVRTPEQALDAAAGAPGIVAVLPLEGAWWGRLLARPTLQVFAAAWPELAPAPPLALAVAAVELDATGDDRTFWVTDAGGTAARVEAQLGEAGFAADLAAEAGGLRLFTLSGFVQAADPRLADAPGRLTGVIGAAPGPLA